MVPDFQSGTGFLTLTISWLACELGLVTQVASKWVTGVIRRIRFNFNLQSVAVIGNLAALIKEKHKCVTYLC